MGASEGPLDNTTKSATPPTRVNRVTGEVSGQFDPLKKWELQAVSRLALGDKHRINVCMRHVRENRTEVDVRRSGESGKTYYSGLMSCGSVWVCPVCAPKIQAVRSQEVRAAIDGWAGTVVLVTQTVPHSYRDALEPLVRGFTDALSRFKAGSPYKRASQRLGIAGSIRALEVTDSLNGWHPHAHTILFLNGHCPSMKTIHRELFKLWKSATARAGFGEVSPDAFHVQDASKVGNYVTKMGSEYRWGPEHELVKAHSKKGRGMSATPFDLLRMYEPRPQCGRYLARFAEYALVFHGRRQLVWSPGLKKRLLGTDGLTDQQISDSIGEADVVLARIPLSDWAIIRKNNLQGHVLEVVHQYGADGLEHLLGSYRPRVCQPLPFGLTDNASARGSRTTG
jgi:hypothetical protein